MKKYAFILLLCLLQTNQSKSMNFNANKTSAVFAVGSFSAFIVGGWMKLALSYGPLDGTSLDQEIPEEENNEDYYNNIYDKLYEQLPEGTPKLTTVDIASRYKDLQSLCEGNKNYWDIVQNLKDENGKSYKMHRLNYEMKQFNDKNKAENIIIIGYLLGLLAMAPQVTKLFINKEEVK